MTGKPTAVVLDGGNLTIDRIVAVARGRHPVDLAPEAEKRMVASVRFKDRLLDAGTPVYGVTTGFGDSANRQVSAAKAAELQRNLVRYHLNGTGPAAEPDVVRATVLIRANSLARGPSAVRPEVVHALLALLRHDVLPVIPERGSLGASGDLVPLCYVAAALIGEGEVRHRGAVRPAREALAECGVEPLVLAAKEGLALINGTAFTAAFAALALHDARELAFAAELATAMACDALRGNASHYHPYLDAAKPHPGQAASAAVIRALLRGSRLTTSYEDLLDRREPLGERHFAVQRHHIQDRYSLRCAPHVVGVLRDTVGWATRWVEVEANSSTDNPLFAADEERVHHGGNFYAGHVGQAADSLKVAAANVADLLDRQLALVVDEKFNAGLTPNLVAWQPDGDERQGLHHGFKGMQIACSSITAEALGGAAPATVFSRSTEAHNQDKVSMATTAARGARTVVGLCREVAAIHLIALAQAIDLRGAASAAPAVRAAHALLRERVPFADTDRRMDHDVRVVVELVRGGDLRRAAGVADQDAAR
ncbi:HAL/PAL/TAL family ammonia-lyase [Saccharothrix obliqua]|uniref:HAL/PAL/TAL family ammonia-lyase n=1 Tax=Saccharothrix obliqua TaxID=2861747 RepID=UPI001C5EDFC4|nr:aromatic amino acid ammonia-lyase [Saccharothrix obliqua]MBW4721478.1 aromatic amino acid ammonia-lyase [Saccharothrix obliqua]